MSFYNSLFRQLNLNFIIPVLFLVPDCSPVLKSDSVTYDNVAKYFFCDFGAFSAFFPSQGGVIVSDDGFLSMYSYDRFLLQTVLHAVEAVRI